MKILKWPLSSFGRNRMSCAKREIQETADFPPAIDRSLFDLAADRFER
jgi:hypothetical protein